VSGLGTLLCLIAYAPIDLPRVATSVETIDETIGTDKIPGWDHWLHDNAVSVRTITTEESGMGRVSARAWGVSNHFTNFKSEAGAEFRHRFLLRRDQIVGGEQYQFDVTHAFRGRFVHFAAVPYPDDPREPPAVTEATVDVRIRIVEVNNQGIGVGVLAASGQIVEHSRTIEPTPASVEELLDDERRHSLRFTPTGIRDVVCHVTTSARAAATGEYSDNRIRGIPPAGRLGMEVRDAQARRVLQEGDYCFDVLSSP
jgi:hypothetical protein